MTNVALPSGLTFIGNYAFRNCANLSSIIIPDNVNSISSYAFYGCTNLTNVTIPDNVTSIGNYAFGNCENLTSAGPLFGEYCIQLGWTKQIPNNAFYGCESLTSIIIPDGVTSIGESAFHGCLNLTSVVIPGSVTSMGSSGGSRYSVFDSDANLTSAGPLGGDYSIQFGWTQKIPDRAFYGITNLTSVTIPDGVSIIGSYAFNDCTNLTYVNIPNSVNSFGGSAFSGCANLTSAGSQGGDYNIQFGWSQKIPWNAFASCENLASVIIPNGVTSIGSNAFGYCKNLINVTIPGSVNEISDSAFNGCTSLTSAGPIGGDYNIQFGWTERIPDSAFTSCSALTSVTIPNGAIRIGGSAFENCASLSNVIIPNSVTSIGNYAFSGCTNLADVYYAGSEEDWLDISIDFERNEPLTSATIHYNSTGPEDDNPSESQTGSVRYFREWDSETQTAYWGDGVLGAQSVAEEGTTDFAFLERIDQLIGNYVLVEDIPSEYGSLGASTLVSIKPVETQWGTVTGGSNGIIYIGDLDYQLTEGALIDGYLDKPVLYHMYEGEIVDIEVLTEREGTLKNWDASTRKIVISDNESGLITTTVSELADEDTIATLNEDTIQNPGVTYLRDGMGFVYQATLYEIDFPSASDLPFSAKVDGWCLLNAAGAFGYREGYHIPASRYYEVFGISLSTLISSMGTITSWEGSCFGLSVLAAGNYNKQIDLSPYFEKDGTLNSYGYEDIVTYKGDDEDVVKNGQNYFGVVGNEDIIATIERAQIAQNAEELKKAIINDGDSTYKELLDHLGNKDTTAPVLVNISKPAHSMLIDPSVEPFEIESMPGWYCVNLYDSLNPFKSSVNIENPATCYSMDSSYLLLDTNTGSWQYYRGTGNRISYVTYSFGPSPNISFYDTAKLGSEFFEGGLSLFGNLIKINFSSSDLQIYDESGNTLMNIVDGQLLDLDQTCEFTWSFDSAVGVDGITRGTISIPTSEFTYESPSANVVVWTEDTYYGINNEGTSKIEVDLTNQVVEVKSKGETDFEICLQKNRETDYDAIGVSGQLENEAIRINAGTSKNTSVSGSVQSPVTILFDSSSTSDSSSYEDVYLNSVSTIDIEGQKVTFTNEQPGDADDSSNSPDNSFTSPSGSVNEKDEEIIEQPDVPKTDIPLLDVPGGAWYETAVGYVYEKGIMSGTGADMFSPNITTTRAMIVTILYRLENTPAVSSVSDFTDVEAGQWYSNAIAWAAVNNIVGGYGNGLFGPADPITREQLAAILYRYAQYKGYDTTARADLTRYTDFDQLSAWAQAAMAWANSEGIVNGTDDTTLSPQGNATRAQAATMLMRFCEHVVS